MDIINVLKLIIKAMLIVEKMVTLDGEGKKKRCYIVYAGEFIRI